MASDAGSNLITLCRGKECLGGWAEPQLCSVSLPGTPGCWLLSLQDQAAHPAAPWLML